MNVLTYLQSFSKRAYTVMEVRTGFATGLPVLSGSFFGAYLTGEIHFLYVILFFIAGFCFNIVANTANEMRAYLAKEENEATFTHHKGSEGLVRGDAKFLDAVFVLLIMIALGGSCGLLLVFLTKDLWLLAWGLVGLLAAITYSLGPKPYLLYPVGEIVSGFFVGGLACYLAGRVQIGSGSWQLLVYSVIPMILTVFLMSTNNVGDYEKDRGVRVTLPHVIGFRNAILLVIPEFLLLFSCWVILLATQTIPWWQFLVGCLIFYRQGWQRWYKDYWKIPAVYPEMGKEYGPRPLLLIYHFNTWMSLLFFIQIMGRKYL